MTDITKKELYIDSSTKPDKANWSAVISKYQTSNTRTSIRQVVNTFIPFFLIWYLMVLSLDYSYWLTLVLALLAAGLLVRIFIIQHDCGHGSFFKSRKANDYLGSVCGILTLTPYYYWRKSHAIHHASAGNLAQRGVGDVYTMTVSEYLQQSTWGRLKYRLYRHPLVLFVLGPVFLFFILYRFPHPESKSWKRERASVWWTNLGLGVLIAALSFTLGFKALLLIYLPTMLLAVTVGCINRELRHWQVIEDIVTERMFVRA